MHFLDPFRGFLFTDKKAILSSLCFFLVIACLISCSENRALETSLSENTGVTSLAPTAQKSNSKGMIKFQIDGQRWTQLKTRSLEQPEVKAEKSAEGIVVLSQLSVGQHTLVIEAQNDQEIGRAAVKNIAVEAGTVFDLGLVPLEKPAKIQGRIVAIRDGAGVANAAIKVHALDLKTSSDAQGHFEFSDVPPGSWTIQVKATGHGIVNNIDVTARADEVQTVGDVWVGDWPMSVPEPRLVNAPQGILTEKKLQIESRFPSNARTFKIVDDVGQELLSRRVLQKSFEIEMTSSGIKTVRLVAYDSRQRVVGEMSFRFLYDPFSNGIEAYLPSATVMQRSIVSPNRTFVVELNNPPSRATEVKIGFASALEAASWQPLQANYSLTLAKDNMSCGSHDISVQYRTADDLVSQELRIPVTLSCWQRIPHRALLERLVGVDNAATWTGKYAFVWSGRLSKTGAVGVRGSYTQDTTEFLESIQGYDYLDGGYVFDPLTKNMEFIVTDYAPAARAKPGVGGRQDLIALFGGEVDGRPLAEGAIYNVATNAWISMNGVGAPGPRVKPSVFFISDHEVLVWGGLSKTSYGYEVAMGDGAIYNMRTHTWRRMSEVQAPSPRHAHVGVWTGGTQPEFVVLGGMRPGEVYLDAGARYNPQTDTWALIPPIVFPAASPMSEPQRFGAFARAGSVHTRLSAQPSSKGRLIVFGGTAGAGRYLRMGFVLDLDSNSVTQKISRGPIEGVADLYLDPQLILDGDGSSANADRLWVIAGAASDVASDVEPRILFYQYQNGVVGADGTLTIFDRADLSSILSWHTIFDRDPTTGTALYEDGKPLYTCCEDWLAFRSGGKTVIMNGTQTNDSSVYTSIISGSISGGRTLNGTTQSSQSKTFLSFQMSFTAEGQLVSERIDGPRYTPTSNRPNGPINVYDLNEPVWDPTSRTLVFFGGRSTDSFTSKESVSGWYTGATQPETVGGWKFDANTFVWTPIPPESSSAVTRRYAPSFLLNGMFLQLGGVRVGSTATYLFDGILIDHRALVLPSPTPVLTTEAQRNLDYSPFSDWGKSLSYGAGFCQDPDQKKLLFVGGRRYQTRTLSGVDITTAHTQQQVLLDGNSTPPVLTSVSTTSLGARNMATLVSTPFGCFVWGGYTAEGSLVNHSWEQIADRYAAQANGAMFQFDTSTWTPIATAKAPSARSSAHGVWTGEEVLVWGGLTKPRLDLDPDQALPKGVNFYNPSTGLWRSHPAVQGEPRFRATERPVWTGRHMFFWKSRGHDASYFYTPSENRWRRASKPFGFAESINAYADAHVKWLGDKLFVNPSSFSRQVSVMALFIPPDP